MSSSGPVYSALLIALCQTSSAFSSVFQTAAVWLLSVRHHWISVQCFRLQLSGYSLSDIISFQFSVSDFSCLDTLCQTSSAFSSVFQTSAVWTLSVRHHQLSVQCFRLQLSGYSMSDIIGFQFSVSDFSCLDTLCQTSSAFSSVFQTSAVWTLSVRHHQLSVQCFRLQLSGYSLSDIIGFQFSVSDFSCLDTLCQTSSAFSSVFQTSAVWTLSVRHHWISV